MVIGLVIGFLWETYTFSVLIGIAVLCVILPIQMSMGKQLSIYFAKAAKLTDERIRLMNEVSVVKFTVNRGTSRLISTK